jgi:2-phospho-L-lactate guanylyltransferase (CobY/MobA/RfbA family)
MADQDILCTHDLTPVSDTALRYALCLADRTGGSTHLLHVTAPDHNDEQYRETAQLLDAASRKAG